MANQEHCALLDQGGETWNEWRKKNPQIRPDLSEADLFGADLTRANLSEADLTGANLSRAHLRAANLSEADLTGAHLSEADLSWADLSEADLTGAHLSEANLTGANLTGANLTGAMLERAQLLETNLENTKLKGCRIYGISAWNLKLNGAKQADLIITRDEEPVITVDDLEVAQFIYLLLNNQRIREVIDTIGKKAVLILGRFTPKRKAVLDALREELRRRDYLPILFDFEKPESRNYRDTITILARLARFIIADLTDAKVILQELEAIVPTVRVPVQPVLESTDKAFGTLLDFMDYAWFLRPYRYSDPDVLLASLQEAVITPAEAKVKELEDKRKAIEEALTKQ